VHDNWAARTNAEFGGTRLPNHQSRRLFGRGNEQRVLLSGISREHGGIAKYLTLIALIAHPLPDAPA
jgi:hypothetical protein